MKDRFTVLKTARHRETNELNFILEVYSDAFSYFFSAEVWFYCFNASEQV